MIIPIEANVPHDRLISKSPEEMAEWVNRHFVCPPKHGCPLNESSCAKCWLDWLLSPAKEGEI